MSAASRRALHGLLKRCECPSLKWPKCPHPWHLTFKFNDRRFSISLDRHVGHPITSKGDALDVARQVRDAIRAGTFGQPVAPPSPAPDVLTFRAFADLWLAQRNPHLAGARDNVYRLKKACDFVAPGRPFSFGSLALTAVTAGDIEAFRDARRAAGKSAYTVNHDLKLLRKMFNWGIRGGYLEATPFKRHGLTTIGLLQETPRAFRFGDTGDEQRLLDACQAHPMLRALVLGLLDTACRPGELLSLQWESVSLSRKEIVIEATKSKTGRRRMIPISSRLLAVLQMRQNDPAGQPLPPTAYVFGNEIGERVQSVRELWDKVRQAAGFDGLQLRDLRHEAGSRLDEAGVPLNYVSKILGHASLTTTTRYLNTHRRGLHQAIAQLEAHRDGQTAGQASVPQTCIKDHADAQADAAPDPALLRPN